MLRLKAVILGAIGVIAETSDIQRQSFNLAFQEQGLKWDWDARTYRQLLSINGGQARLRSYRDADPARSEVSDAAISALHASKTRHYAALTSAGSLVPRRGIAQLIEAAKTAGVKVALCTSTSSDNVDALRTALGAQLDWSAFVSITTINKIERVKPAPDAYLHCLAQLGLRADEVVAIEDTPVSMASAMAAGIAVIATSGAMTDNQDFSGAALITDDLATLTLQRIDAVLA